MQITQSGLNRSVTHITFFTKFGFRVMKKSKLHTMCVEILQSQINELQSAIDKVQESVVNEQNSTAGNKFETARAMGQEELDRLNRQMSNAQKQMVILSQINPDLACETAQLGAIIKTTKKQMYLSIGLGRVEVDGETYFSISAISPIGINLMGKKEGEMVEFAGKRESIKEIR